ncbi:MAG: hypothetical protein QOK43_334 [Acidimicrobiaceae bacterium]|nr:hypothetical protein [Acidimicrobiaceae bacterium]
MRPAVSDPAPAPRRRPVRPALPAVPTARVALVSLLLVAAATTACSKKDRRDATAPPVSATASTAPLTATTNPLKSAVPTVPGTPAVGSTAKTTIVTCDPVPAAGTQPAPPGLPSLPPGAVVRWTESTTQNGSRIYTAALKESLENLQQRAVKNWPAEGWRELFGEAEPGREIEGVFAKDITRVGMRARTGLYCDPAWLEVRMAVTG